jgi:putative MATE family efflux protein
MRTLPTVGVETPATGEDSGVPAVATGGGDLLHGSIDRVLLRLAGPAILAKALHAGLGLVDVFWVGRLGAAPTAAVTTSFFASWVLLSATDLTALGILAHVARNLGAGDRTRAAHASSQGMLLGIGLGGVLALVAWIVTPALFASLHAAPDVVAPGVAYLRIFYLAAPLTFTCTNAEFAMRAAGNTRTPLLVTAGMVLVNAVLDPLLIFGWGPIPASGVHGAAYATFGAQVLGVGGFAWLAVRRHPHLPLARASLRAFDRRLAANLLRIGAPGMAMGSLFAGIYLFMSGIAARIGTAPLAVMGLANRVESVTYLVCHGFGAATATLVGQNLGARQVPRAARAAWRSVWWMLLYGVATGAVMILFPRTVLAVFSNDAAVLDAGVPYLRILGIAMPFMAVEIVLENAFAGAGDNVPPMVISVPMNLIRVPLLVWTTTIGAGLLGIVWVVTSTAVARGILAAVWFHRGRWAERRL